MYSLYSPCTHYTPHVLIILPMYILLSSNCVITELLVPISIWLLYHTLFSYQDDQDDQDDLYVAKHSKL